VLPRIDLDSMGREREREKGGEKRGRVGSVAPARHVEVYESGGASVPDT